MIYRSNGALRIAKASSVFECGNVLVPQVVIGQAHGAFAMGVGGTFLETLPLYERARQRQMESSDNI